MPDSSSPLSDGPTGSLLGAAQPSETQPVATIVDLQQANVPHELLQTTFDEPESNERTTTKLPLQLL